MAVKLSKVPSRYKRVCGIYLISCNEGKERCVYVGSSIDVYVRAKEHFNCMRRGQHTSLQKKFDELGGKVFSWKILEDCSHLLKKFDDYRRLNFEIQKREQHFIDKYYKIFQERLLNKSKSSFGTMGTRFKQSEETCKKKSIALMGHKVSEKVRKILCECRKNNKVSAETRKKMSIAGIGKKHSEQWRKNQSISLKGKYVGNLAYFYGKKHTEETKKKMSMARTLYYRRKKCLSNITNEEVQSGNKKCLL